MFCRVASVGEFRYKIQATASMVNLKAVAVATAAPPPLHLPLLLHLRRHYRSVIIQPRLDFPGINVDKLLVRGSNFAPRPDPENDDRIKVGRRSIRKSHKLAGAGVQPALPKLHGA